MQFKVRKLLLQKKVKMKTDSYFTTAKNLFKRKKNMNFGKRKKMNKINLLKR